MIKRGSLPPEPKRDAMDCQKLLDLLVDYIDEELDPRQHLELDEHLAKCPPCVDFLDSYRRTGSACREALQAQMPEAMKTRLSEFLRQRIQCPDS